MDLPHALRRRRPRSHVLALAVTAAMAVTMAAVSATTAPNDGLARGAATARAKLLFDEGAHAPARLRGDRQALPPPVARCAGCHDRGETSAKLPASRAEPVPRLDAATLLQPASRRRGPPSRYDEATFCRLLATGVDPAGIVVARAMPVYEVEPSDCRALWWLLTAPPS